ncbi:MAG: baseplate J/gp47 family protein, partial [Candidatus Saccharibacteria bacterium]|nr:baseplate J/gp47 family protein [Candidatus Saccharibacteria bacterium]
SVPVSLNVNGTTDVDAKTIKPTVQQTKKTFQSDFAATGKKDIGTKATGMVTIKNCADSDPISVPAGSTVSSNGLNFLTTSSISVPGGTFKPNCSKAGTANVSVQAQDMGDSYNLSSGSAFTVSGQGSGVSASNPGAFTGGAKRTATIVSDNDINTAKAKIIDQNKDAGKSELTKKFDTKKYVVIDKSYKADPTTVTSSPPSGSEATTAHLTVELTYSLTGLDKDDVNAVLNAYLKDKIDKNSKQKIYDNGISKLQFEGYTDNTVTLNTTGYIGPFIDTKNLKKQIEGKNYEDIRQQIKAIEGVQDVDTKFFPFWVSTAPGADKIDIKFVVQKNE